MFLLDLLTGVMLTLDPWVDNKALSVQLQKVDHDANGQAHQTHLVTLVQKVGCRVGDGIFGRFVT